MIIMKCEPPPGPEYITLGKMLQVVRAGDPGEGEKAMPEITLAQCKRVAELLEEELECMLRDHDKVYPL